MRSALSSSVQIDAVEKCKGSADLNAALSLENARETLERRSKNANLNAALVCTVGGGERALRGVKRRVVVVVFLFFMLVTIRKMHARVIANSTIVQFRSQMNLFMIFERV